MSLLLHTPVCEVLGIRHPVMQAGMACAANGRLAAAVAEAGGLGTIGSNPGWVSADEQIDAVRHEVRLARSLTDKPISLNIPIVYKRADELLEIAREERVPVVSLTAGNPDKLIPRAHEYGLKVISVVGSLSQALRVEASGVDVIVVEGTEAGGLNHPDGISILALLPKITAAVRTPIAAAGGFADGRGLAAGLCLGAQAVQLGTRFLASEECHVHDAYKRLIVEAGPTGTFLVWKGKHFPTRALRTPYAEKIQQLEQSGTSKEEVAALIVEASEHATQMLGDLEAGTFTAGMSSYLVDDVLPAGEIVRRVVEEAVAVLGQTSSYVVDSETPVAVR
jgi:enoyl-[acyl-carrier protein] reductase II